MEKVGSVGDRQGVFWIPEHSRHFGKEVTPTQKQKEEGVIAAPEEEKEEKELGIEEVREALNQINETLRIYRTELRFVLHEESGEYMVKVINAETQEVIREIPPEWVLKIVASVKRMLGLILDKFI